MFRFREFKLNFSTAKDVFRPGDQIPCKVILNIDGQMETKGIEVISKGYCYWRHGWRTAFETLYENKRWMFGDGYNNYIHPSGRTGYPMIVKVPTQTPSSFVSENAFILYTIEIKIHGSAGTQKIHSQIKRYVTVRELIDPNLPRYALGVANEHNLVDCFGGKMTFAASIDRACYFPQEEVYMNVNIDNQTDNRFTLEVKLVQYFRYRLNCGFGYSCSAREVSEMHVLRKLSGARIARRGLYQWINEKLKIPQCEPTIKSSLVKVSYILEFKVFIGFGKNLKIQLPLVIGTVPHRSSMEHQQHQDQRQIQQSRQRNMTHECTEQMAVNVRQLPSTSSAKYEALINNPPHYDKTE